MFQKCHVMTCPLLSSFLQQAHYQLINCLGDLTTLIEQWRSASQVTGVLLVLAESEVEDV